MIKVITLTKPPSNRCARYGLEYAPRATLADDDGGGASSDGALSDASSDASSDDLTPGEPRAAAAAR